MEKDKEWLILIISVIFGSTRQINEKITLFSERLTKAEELGTLNRIIDRIFMMGGAARHKANIN